MSQDIIDADVRPLAVRDEPGDIQAAAPHSLAMLDATTPEEYMERISRVCKILVDVVEKQKLAKKLGRGDKKHVELEAWQFLGSMPWIRCSAIIEWTKEVGDGQGWEARAQVYRDGVIVGAGEGMCLRSESNWKAPKDYFALRSMAQSRAMSRALQGPLRFIFVLAGYAGAGAEEMPPDAAAESAPREPAKPPAESAAAIEERRQRGIRGVHIYCNTHKIDTKGDASPYRRILLEEFPDVFSDPAVDVSSKALDLPQLQRFSLSLQSFVREVRQNEEAANG